MDNNKGYTIVELICGVIIMCIVILIAIPSYKTIRNAKFRVDARNLVNDIRYTKDLTDIYGLDYKIIFDKYGYKIVEDGKNTVKEYNFTNESYLEKYELSQGSKKVNFMSYNSSGNGIASGSLVISNQDGSQKKKITIVPVTGRVLLSDI